MAFMFGGRSLTARLRLAPTRRRAGLGVRHYDDPARLVGAMTDVQVSNARRIGFTALANLDRRKTCYFAPTFPSPAFDMMTPRLFA